MPEPDQCQLCERRKEPSSDFCDLHKSAFENIESAYPAWSKAYGRLTKQEYYDRLEGLNETGRGVKDIIQYLKSKGVFT